MKKKFSLVVSNPEEENYPAGWSVANYIAANPDLRSLQIMDQVAILNATSGLPADNDAFAANTELMLTIATQYAGFTATSWDPTDSKKLKYLQSFNIYGVDNEPAVFSTMVLDSNAIAQQYVAYGRREGRPFRPCNESETGLVAKGECQAEIGGIKQDQLYYDNHTYCSRGGVSYCIDCGASDACPVMNPTTPDPSTTDEPAAPAES